MCVCVCVCVGGGGGGGGGVDICYETLKMVEWSLKMVVLSAT